MSDLVMDYTDVDVVATAERLIEEHGKAEAWESICELGAAAEAEMDERRWIQGDLSELIGMSYSDDLIGEFAKRCKVAKKTMYERRQVSAFYTKSARADFSSLGYSIFRQGLKLKTLTRALRWLMICDARGYTVDQAAYRLKIIMRKAHPDTVKLVDTETVIADFDRCKVGFTLTPDQFARLIHSYDNKKPVRLMIVGEPEPEVKEAQSA